MIEVKGTLQLSDKGELSFWMEGGRVDLPAEPAKLAKAIVSIFRTHAINATNPWEERATQTANKPTVPDTTAPTEGGAA